MEARADRGCLIVTHSTEPPIDRPLWWSMLPMTSSLLLTFTHFYFYTQPAERNNRNKIPREYEWAGDEAWGREGREHPGKLRGRNHHGRCFPRW